MAKNKNYRAANMLVALSALVVFATGCTKKRDATLPDELASSVFAISEFGDVQPENVDSKIQTSDAMKELSYGDQAKAINEKGVIEVDADHSKVNDHLKFMFKKLEIQGNPNAQYKVTFAVDREYVTAFKVVENMDELSILEKTLAQTPSQVKAQVAIQKAQDKKEVQTLTAQIKNTQKKAPVLVPIFKFKVTGYGVIQRTKNELKEETSTLNLSKTDWSQATHITISNNVADRLPISVSAAQKEELDQVFVMNRVNNKIMTADVLNQQLGIATNLSDETKVLTRLDASVLRIFEITTVEKAQLSESEKQVLNNKIQNGRVDYCSDEIKKALAESERKNCIVVSRLSYPVAYVSPSLPDVNFEGSQANTLEFKSVLARNNVGLVKIVKNSVPDFENDPSYVDPRYTVRVSQIKNKEFFFRRTFEQATSTAMLVSGMMGNVQLVKFELQEDKLVVKKTEQVVNFKKDKSSLDQEEVMSIPVVYYRELKLDAAGNEYRIPKLQRTNKESADLIFLDWTQNSIPVINSPLAFYADGQCFRSVNDKNITDLDMRLQDKGILNFSYTYSVTLDPSCASSFDGINDYNGTDKTALVQGVKERISFKLNDGQTDKSYVPNVPFTAQNALGYGVFTNGVLKPSENGLYGREGSQIDYPLSHDFRNGKVVTYTIGGLPENEGRYLNMQDNQRIDLRETYKEIAVEVIAEWNSALHRAFKGTSLDRKGDYINYEVVGENGVSAKLGDLDKHFIWFENTVNTNYGILGVSQAGINPRSGIITADAVIIYAANINYYIEYERKNLQLMMQFNKQMDALKQEGLKQLAEMMKNADTQPGQAGANEKAGTDAGTALKNRIQFIDKVVARTSLNNRPERFTPANLIGSMKSGLRSDRIQALSQQLKSGISLRKDLDVQISETENAYVHRIVKKALAMDISSRNLENIEYLTAQEILHSFENTNMISDLEKSALRTKVKMMQVRQRLMDVYKNRPGCLTMAREALGQQYATMTFRDAIKLATKPTLAHEMGHSLGLTHNFIASTDKNNFNFADEKGEVRNYSSVMDYMVESQQKYAGPGPYDVYAIRAAYTGMIESDKGLVSVEKIKQAIGGQWTALNKMTAAQLPIHKYKYCTDIDVLWEPTCQRHDLGTTATEIVDNLIKDYNETYVGAYHDYDRLRFGYSAKVAAVSRAIDNMLRARQFMDETFYKAIMRSGTQEEIQDYFQASFNVYKFLMSVIRTPDADGLFTDPSRFAVVPYQYQEAVRDEKGQPVLDEKGQPKLVDKVDIQVVEKRSISDVAYDQRRYDTLGIEQNKLIAMEILTMKGYPSMKYMQASLNLSFVDFEKYGLGIQDPGQSSILMTLTEILNNNLQPAFTNDKVLLSPLPAEFKASVTNSMRVYAGISSILALESTTLKDKDNFATLFKVSTTKGVAPRDRLSITQSDAADKSTQKLNYFALDNALIANSMIRDGHRLLTIIKNSEPIQTQLAALLENQIKKDSAALEKSKAGLLAALNNANKSGELLSAEDLKANPNLSFDNQIKLVLTLNEKLYTSDTAKQLLASIAAVQAKIAQDPNAAQDKNIQQFAAQIMEIKNANTTMAQTLPLMALAQRTLVQYTQAKADKSGKVEDTGMAGVLQFILADDDFETRYGILLNSIDFLSKLTRLTNPEMTR